MTQVALGGRRARHIARIRGPATPGRRGWGPGLVAAVLLGLSWAGAGSGAPGALDPTFGAGEVAITFGPQDFANALIRQPDGKLVVAGYAGGAMDVPNAVLLVRYLPRLVPDCQDQGAVTLLVGRLYQQVLTRVPSWEEIVWWTQDIITWCALPDAVEGFFNSLEYLSVPRTLADHVTVLYRALLAREPDAGGLAWGVGGLAGQLATLEDDVMASPEFEAQVYRLFP
jgi:hypothetical protein